MKNQIITIQNLPTLVGKTIKWSAPAAQGNKAAKGIAKITAVDLSKHQPITAEIIEGRNLQFAFIDRDYNPGGSIGFSDSDRYISFQIVS